METSASISAPKSLPPNVLDYRDYRSFLKDFYIFKKSLRKGFSYRLFAKRASLKSPNYLQLIMQGKRNLQIPTAENIAKALQLTAVEKKYFLALVEKDLSESLDLEQRENAERNFLKLRGQLLVRYLPQAQRNVLSSPYHLLIRELFCLKDFCFDANWISKKLMNLVSPEDVSESLKLLSSLNMIRLDKGKWKVSDGIIDTGHEYNESLVLKNHISTFKHWFAVLETLSPEQRELGLMNIPVHSSKLPEFKQRIRAFQDEIVGWLENEQEADMIVQLGTYLVPATTKS